MNIARPLGTAEIEKSLEVEIGGNIQELARGSNAVFRPGEGTDAEMMRSYLAAWGDKEAYAVSHVGFGMNRKARYEALAMYDRRDTNGTELRAVAGNFLFSTGANEFAGRYTAGHFDIPVMRTTITVDGTVVVREGALQDVFG